MPRRYGCHTRSVTASVGGAAFFLVLSCLGCSSSEPAPQPADPAPVAVQPEPEPGPEPQIDWNARIDAAANHVTAGELEVAGEALKEIETEAEDLEDEQKQRLATIGEELKAAEAERENVRREEALTAAEGLISEGDLEEATRRLDGVLVAGPTSDQKRRADEMLTKIEETRRIRRELGTAMRLLTSEKRSDVRAARSRLWQDSEVALPMLLEALESDNPTLVANALEVLRVFNQPERTLPAMIGVLANPQQTASWPAAIRELQKLQTPGAGERLLELAESDLTPEQRAAALTALAGVNDPPRRTFVTLLPWLFEEGPALAPALRAVHHAAELHGQLDPLSRRGFQTPLTDEQNRRLAELPVRLTSLAGAATPEDELSEDESPDGTQPENGQPQDAQPDSPSRAAAALGVATRLLEAKPLAGAKLDRVNQEYPDSPAAKAADGETNTVEPAEMWRHPLGRKTLIVFDLGQERTVTGVRIWNLNWSGGTHRGWKDVDIFVSDSPALLRPVTSGTVAPAPGRLDAGDYSVTLPVPFVRGRYVKLEPRDVWRDDGNGGGVTEIQILGF